VQHPFRLSQRRKPESSTEQYGRVLRAALETYLDRPRVPSLEAFLEETGQRLADGSIANAQESLEQFVSGLLSPLARDRERYNARRLELEALRPDRRLSAVHEAAVEFLRGGDRVTQLQLNVLGTVILDADRVRARKKEQEAEAWHRAVAQVQGKLLKALQAVQRD